ncbi:hypothetical protein GCM10028805_54580 [Spirosoma harenae]
MAEGFTRIQTVRCQPKVDRCGRAAGAVKREEIGTEYTGVESRKNTQRVELAAAIDRAKREGAVLVIAKLAYFTGEISEYY